MVHKSTGQLQGCAVQFADEKFLDAKALGYPGRYAKYCVTTQRPLIDLN